MTVYAQRVQRIGQQSANGSYYEKGFITFMEKARIRANLILAGWQHIRIEEVRGGYTEIHATRPQGVQP